MTLTHRRDGRHGLDPVPPLPVPPAGAARDAGTAGQHASVRLFTERAQAAAPGFRLTGQNVGAVAEICRRLDGLPLAIELAAARVRLLPPQALLARLGDPMGVLTGGPRDVPERQRTLQNTLDWSFSLLSPGEQALFACLGVFAGTFGLPAAEAVWGDAGAPGQADPSGLVMDILNVLVDSSLVEAETRGAYYLEALAAVALQQDDPPRAARAAGRRGCAAAGQRQRVAARIRAACPA